MTATELPSLAPELFRQQFVAIAPLILSEWSGLDAEQLSQTNGDLEQVVDLVATHTERTRTLIRRQLRELYQLAVIDAAEPPTANAPAADPLTGAVPRLSKLVTETLADADVKATIARLEERTEKLLDQFKQEVMPELNDKVQKNVGGSLLTALGIGFVLGLLLGGGRGR